MTGAFDFDGVTITLDAAAATQVVSSAAVSWNFTSGAKTGTPGTTGSVERFSAQTFTDNNTAGSGTAAAHVFFSVAIPTLAATNTLVTTTDAATWYIAGVPAAGTNETITNSWGLWVDAGNVRFDDDIIWLSGQTFAQRGILAHANTGIRTYTFPDETGTVVTTLGAAFTGAVTTTSTMTTSGAGTILGIGTGARMTFQQTSAPTGWTKETSATYNDAALRFQTGTVTTGGSDAFSTHFGTGKSTASYTLAIADIPSHSHVQRRINTAGGVNAFLLGQADGDTETASAHSTSVSGGGGGHSHVLNSFNIKFVDTIIGIKD